MTLPKSAAIRPVARWASMVAGLAIGAAAQAMTPAEFFAKAAPSVWLVRTYDKDGLPLATGSAVVIAPDTLITNCHVLRKAGTFKLIHESVALPGKLEMWDPARDVCQVRATGLGAPAVDMGDTTQLVVGQPVYALGAPRGLELTLSNGLVSSLRHDAAQRVALIQTSAPVSHGSSGGGLFDVDGRLIGITSSGFDDAQNLNFALPVDYIRELPARHLAALQNKPSTVAAPLAPVSPAPAPAGPATAIAAPPPSGPTGSARIPFLNDARQQLYWMYLADSPYPKACAISDNGHFACVGGFRPKDRSLPTDPQQRALALCAQYAGRPCVLYQVDDQVVYRPASPTP